MANAKHLGVLVLLAVLAVLISGCSSSDHTTTQTPLTPAATPTQPTETSPSISDYYTGFLKAERGAWAEWEMTDSKGKTTNLRFVYAGRAIMNGKESEGFEYRADVNGQEVIAQVWFSVDNRNVVKYVIKYQGKVICYTPPQFEVKPSSRTPSEYEPKEISKKPDVGFGTFTTKSGKTVKVVKFSEIVNGKQREVWLSSEVTFGIVKVVEEGKTVVELVDFGLSGGQVTITSEEAENCMSIPSLFGGFGGG